MWKPVPSTDGVYEVSDDGKVRRVPGTGGWSTKGPNGLDLQTSHKGYHVASITLGGHRKTRTVHSLVAEAFIGPRPECMQINHKDGNKKNNSPSNLEYVSGAENSRHAVRLGLLNPRIGEENGSAKLDRDAAVRMASLRGQRTRWELAQEFDVSESTVGRVLAGKHWGHATGIKKPKENPMPSGKVNSRQKGKRMERQAAAFLVSLGFDDAVRGQQRSGRDIADVVCETTLPGVHFEVKGGYKPSAFSLGGVAFEKAILQSRRDAGDKMWCVLWRLNRVVKWFLTFEGVPAVCTVCGEESIKRSLLWLQEKYDEAAKEEPSLRYVA